MLEFESWQDFWKFEKATKNQSRYIHSSKVKTFLDTVLQTAEKHIEVLPKDGILWRAQLGCGWEPLYEQDKYIDDIPAPYSQDRMKPLKERAREGRANPKGIPYLYLATHHDTALAEVRPWIGSSISAAQFKTLRELRLVNFSTDKKGFIVYLEEPSAEKREGAVWADIDRAFARPVDPSDEVADYVPTQIIAELFKANGFDGIAYRSSLGDGHNIVLFDLDVAELIDCHLFQAESIKFEFKEYANPYFIHKQ